MPWWPRSARRSRRSPTPTLVLHVIDAAASDRDRRMWARPPGARGGRRDRRAPGRGVQQVRPAQRRRAPPASGTGAGRRLHLGAAAGGNRRARRDDGVAARAGRTPGHAHVRSRPMRRIASGSRALYRHARVVVHEARDGQVSIVADVPRRLLPQLIGREAFRCAVAPRHGSLRASGIHCSVMRRVLMASMAVPDGSARRLRANGGAGAGRHDPEVSRSSCSRSRRRRSRAARPLAMPIARGVSCRPAISGTPSASLRSRSKAAPAFYPAEASAGYVELARKDPAAALPHFDRALERQADYVSALVGKGHALLALEREGDALAAFEAAYAADPSLADVRRRVEVLRFRAVEQRIGAAREAAAAGRLDEAVRAYGSAIASSPDSAFLYRELAAVERRPRRRRPGARPVPQGPRARPHRRGVAGADWRHPRRRGATCRAR